MAVFVVARLSLLVLFLNSADCQYQKQKNVRHFQVPEIYAPRNSSMETKCDDQVKIYMDSLQKFEPWALEMFDASSKIPSGFFRGNIRDLGMYDQCLNVSVNLGNEIIRGQHCMYSIDITFNGTNPSPLPPMLSVCIPDTCRPDQVVKRMQGIIDMAKDFMGDIKIKVVNATCSQVDDAPWELGALITLGVFGLLLTFLLICTICDVLSRFSRIDSGFLNTLSKFSLILNGERILSTRAPKDNIQVISGLRFYSLCWIILAHIYRHLPDSAVNNMVDVHSWFHSWRATPIFVAAYSVDTFLVMTGFLTSYMFIKNMAGGRGFNIFGYYIHRYLRLTPAFGALLAIVIFLLPKLGSGALWPTLIGTESDQCRKEWWPTLLYIHNYVYDKGGVCLTHSWYLAVDMQLVWISPFIMLPLSTKPKIGLIILGAALVASVVIPAAVVAVNKFPAMFVLNTYFDDSMLLDYYILTYNRTGPWLLGILVGYLIASGQSPPGPKLRILGWMLTILAFAFTFFSYRVYQSEDYQWNIYWETFYAGFMRNIWSLGVCWIIYVSTLGHGGLVSRFLSLPIFLPFSRISYSVYLIHYVYQTVRSAYARAPIYAFEFLAVQTFISDLVILTAIGFFFSLIFESPFLVLEKMIFVRKPEVEPKVEPKVEPETASSRKLESYYISNDMSCNEPDKNFN